MVGTSACKPRGNNKGKGVSDIIAGVVQWSGKSTSQPMDVG